MIQADGARWNHPSDRRIACSNAKRYNSRTVNSMSSFETLKHCGAFCEVVTRHGTHFGVLLRFSATAFILRAIGLDPRTQRTDMIEASDIVRIAELPMPRR
jgi:hypothetical protein